MIILLVVCSKLIFGLFFIGVVNFNGRYGCQKCTVIGKYCKKFRRMSFPDLDAPLRTDSSFRNRANTQHHKNRSLLENLNIDMVYSFPSSDPLHLLDLGVMKRCLVRWVFGEKSYSQKWNKNKVAVVSQQLESCRKYMPTDIHRAVRNLDCLRKWKGVEFRTILLYVGMVVFKEVLPADEFNHFMILCCAVRICCSSTSYVYLDIAEKMFIAYVQQYIVLYGEHSVGSNVHLLRHIIEDMRVNKVRNLMEISTYRFENCLRLLGLKLKNGHLPLEQISRRIIEMSQLHSSTEGHRLFNAKKFSPQVFSPRKHGNLIVYDEVEIAADIVLKSKRVADSWFITQKDEVVKMAWAEIESNECKIVGNVLRDKEAAFSTPLNSVRLKIFCSDGKLDEELSIHDIKSIVSKVIHLPSKDKFIFMPILHTMGGDHMTYHQNVMNNSSQ